MTEEQTTAGLADTDDQHQADLADDNTDRPAAEEGLTPSLDDTRDRADADAVDPEAAEPEPIDPGATDTAPGTRKSASRLIRTMSFGVVPTLVVVSALGVAYLKYTDSTAVAAEQARVESLVTAKNGTVAMLSYTPDTADKDLTAARNRLTGTFRDSYSSLIHDVVIPGAKQQKVSATATVPAAASISANHNHAVVLVYVNQAITVGNGAPTQSNSVVQVTLDRSGNKWLISGFDPK